MDKDFLFARSSWQPPSTKENSTALESKRQLLSVGSYCIWQKKLTLRCTQLCLFVLLVFCAFWALCVPGKFNDQSLLSQHAVFLPIPKSFWVLFLLFFPPISVYFVTDTLLLFPWGIVWVHSHSFLWSRGQNMIFKCCLPPSFPLIQSGPPAEWSTLS